MTYLQCGLACHKKCLETLAIQCGHKRLPRKMTTFGVDLTQHLGESNVHVPHLILKCVKEIDERGINIKVRWIKHILGVIKIILFIHLHNSINC